MRHHGRNAARAVGGWLVGCILALIAVPVSAGTATLSWEAPTQRTDGSALTNLAGFRLYERCGSASYGAPISLSATQTQHVRSGLPDGTTCYWQMTAVDSAGVESARTAEVSKVFPAIPLELPGAPGSLVIEWKAAAAPPTGPPEVSQYISSFTLGDSASPVSAAVTVPEGATFAILHIAGWRGDANWLNTGSWTLNGQAFTPIADTDNQTNNEQIWVARLANPTSGTLAATWTGGNPGDGLSIQVHFFSGVDLANPLRGTPVVSNNGGNANTTGLTVEAGDLALGLTSTYSQYPTLTPGTLRSSHTSNNAYTRLYTSDQTSTTGFTMASGSYSSQVALVLRAAAAGTTPVASDVAGSYATEQYVASDLSGNYTTALQLVASDLEGSYAAIGTVASDLAGAYTTEALATDPEILSVAEVIIGTQADPASVNVSITPGTTAAYFLGYNYLNNTPAGWTSATLAGQAPDQEILLNDQYARPGGDSGNLALWVWYDPPSGTQALDVLMRATSANGPLGFLVCTRNGDTTAWRDAEVTNGFQTGAVAATVTTEVGDLVLVLDARYDTGGVVPGNETGWNSELTEANNNLAGRVRSLVATGASVTANVQNPFYSGLIAVAIARGQASTTPVASDLGGSYGTTAYVASDLVGAYGSGDTVASDLAGSYGTTAYVASDLAGSYGTTAYVASNLAGSYVTQADGWAAWQAALARVQNGEGNATILCLGDSTTAGDAAGGSGMANNARAGSWPVRLAAAISHVKASAANFLGSNDADDATTLANYDDRLTLPSGWALDGSVDVISADLFYRASGGNALPFQPGVEFDRVELFYRNIAGSSQFSVNVDGGASLGSAANNTTPPPYYGRQTFITGASLEDFAAVNYALTTTGPYQRGRLTQLPEGFGDGEFTLELWVRASNIANIGQTQTGAGIRTNWATENGQPEDGDGWWYYGNFLIDGHNNSTLENGTFSLQVFNSGRLRWTFGDGAAAGAIPGDLHGVQNSNGVSILDGEWHKVVCVRRWDGGTGSILELYVDGQLQDTANSTARSNMAALFWDTWADQEASGTGQSGWYFAAEKFAALTGPDWSYFKGDIASVAFWSIARSAADLTTNWQAPLVGNEAGLVGLYRHNEAAGTAVADDLASGGNITLLNGPTWAVESPFPGGVEPANATVNIVASGSTGRLHGARVWRSDQPEISIINAGWWGGTTVQAANAGNTASLNGIRNIAPDLTIVFLGINDIWSAGTSEANYRAALRAIIEAALETGGVLLVKPHYIGTGPSQSTQANFYANIDTVAAEYGVPVFDLAARWGTYAAANAAGFMAADAVHITAAGYNDIADAMLGEAIGIVTSSLAGSYATRIAVSSDLAGSYAAQGTVASDLGGAYGAQAFVASDLAAAYSVLETVAADLAGSYATQIAGTGSGNIGTIAVSPPEAAATGGAVASGANDLVVVVPPAGAAAGSAAAAGAVGTVSLTSPTGGATGGAAGAGALGTISVAAPTAAANGGGTSDTGDAQGALPTIAVSAPQGAGSGSGNAGGSLVAVAVSAPQAAAAGGVTGAGDLGTIAVSAPQGAGSGAATATGGLATVTITPPTATAGATVVAEGDIGTVAVSPPQGSATGGATAAGGGAVVLVISPAGYAGDPPEGGGEARVDRPVQRPLRRRLARRAATSRRSA